MYKNAYHIPELEKYGIKDYVVNTYDDAIEKLIQFLDYYNITDWFSYTKFDHRHLPELHDLYNWFDISIPAKNVKTNDFIPKDSLTFKNGALNQIERLNQYIDYYQEIVDIVKVITHCWML